MDQSVSAKSVFWRFAVSLAHTSEPLKSQAVGPARQAAQRLGMCPHSRCPGFVEVQRHLPQDPTVSGLGGDHGIWHVCKCCGFKAQAASK